MIIVVNAALKYPGISALVTVGAKKVMSLLALSSSLQLTRLGLGRSFLEDLVWCWSPVEDILSFTSSGFTSVDSSPLSDGVLVVKVKSKRG